MSDTIAVKRPKTASIETPVQFFLQLLLDHPESLWKYSLEEAVVPQWERCVEYFDLLCNLLHDSKGKHSTVF